MFYAIFYSTSKLLSYLDIYSNDVSKHGVHYVFEKPASDCSHIDREWFVRRQSLQLCLKKKCTGALLKTANSYTFKWYPQLKHGCNVKNRSNIEHGYFIGASPREGKNIHRMKFISKFRIRQTSPITRYLIHAYKKKVMSLGFLCFYLWNLTNAHVPVRKGNGYERQRKNAISDKSVSKSGDEYMTYCRWCMTYLPHWLVLSGEGSQVVWLGP